MSLFVNIQRTRTQIKNRSAAEWIGIQIRWLRRFFMKRNDLDRNQKRRPPQSTLNEKNSQIKSG